MATNDRGLGALTVLDWNGIVLTAVLIGYLSVFSSSVRGPLSMYDAMDPDVVPFATRLVAIPWAPLAVAVAPAGLLAIALRRDAALGQRRASAVLAFVVTLALLMGCWWAVMAPLMRISDRVR